MKISYSMMAVAALLWGAGQAAAYTVTTPAGQTVDVTFMNDNILRVTSLHAGQAAAAPTAAVMKPEAVDVTVTDGPIVTLTSPSGLSATVDKSSGAVNISSGGARMVYDAGVRTTDADGHQSLSLAYLGKGTFYGAGERGHSVNLEGDTLVMYNRQNYGYTAGDPRISQMNITMPLFVAKAGYAIVFDDYAAATMVMGNPIVYTTESSEPVTYYYIDGHGSLPEVSHLLTELVGRQDLPPLWALGYITSKYGYHDRRETTGVIDTLRREGYPVDGVVLDLYWYGKEQDMGRLDWDPVQWPDHSRMLADLKKRGVNTVAISQPYVLRNGRGVDNYNELRDGGMLLRDTTGAPQEVKIWVGEGGMLDVSNPDTRAWLRDRYRRLTDEGITGWWGDLGEPEVHPETGVHHNGLPTRLYHNLYGNDWSAIIYDLFAEEYPDTRLMTMMRGGTTGLQRYSVFPWSTDVSRSWGGLQPQITIMLNSGLSGLGYMGHDVGGFAIDPAAPYDPELYVRWLQLGTFSPILRTHAQATAEPYHYPQQRDIIRPLILERYRWLPYNYTLAYRNSLFGEPLVQPIGYYDKESLPASPDMTDQYLWGRDVMIAPVLTQGATSREVVFPQGKWVDMRSPAAVYAGGTTATVDAPLEVLPMFARAGAIIPMADYKMDNTTQYRTDTYTLNVYPVEGESGSYTLYEDDLTSRSAIAADRYAAVDMTDSMTDGKVTFTAKFSGSYPGLKPVKKLTVKFHGIDTVPAAVTVDGKTLRGKAVKYTPEDGILTITTDWNISNGLKIEF
ncbi:MAG: DUF5110 domain-containing protein [Duncaniella sp.]|nr:DUF5110 domain-containing protein [Duncaniella sp.]